MTDFQWVAVAVVASLSAARITRLVTYDVFPPIVWVRRQWDKVTGEGGWNIGLHCGYCFGLWAALLVVGWGYLSDFHVTWWLFNSWMAVGYLAAIVMAFDGDE